MITSSKGALSLIGLLLALPAAATIVELDTNLGPIRINLYDVDTPETVANFLDYASAGEYDNSVFHRKETDFVVQGGGFRILNGELPLVSVNTVDPVVNEPVFSNVRGTISMAKFGGNPNSATSQWFINTINNSTNLDNQNGGFTAFGQVIDSGMDVVDAINDLPTFNFGGSTTTLPLQDFTSDDFSADLLPEEDNFIIVRSVTIIDATVDTASELDKPLNTLINLQPDPEEFIPTKRGGSTGVFALLTLLLFTRRRSVAR